MAIGALGEATVSLDQKFAAVSSGNRIHVWDIGSRKQISSLVAGKEDFIWGPKFSPDGKRIVAPVNGDDGMQLRVWDVQSGEKIATFGLGAGEGTYVQNVTWSPDGKRFVTANANGVVQMWDANTGKHLFDPPAHTNFVWQIVFSPDGTKIATASRDGTAIVSEAETGKEITRLVGHTSTVDSLDWSPDGKYIVTAGSDATAKVWDAASGTELLTFDQGLYPVEMAIFTADGKRVITTSDDGAIRVYTLDVNELVQLAKARLIRTWRADECQKFLQLDACPQTVP